MINNCENMSSGAISWRKFSGFSSCWPTAQIGSCINQKTIIDCVFCFFNIFCLYISINFSTFFEKRHHVLQRRSFVRISSFWLKSKSLSSWIFLFKFNSLFQKFHPLISIEYRCQSITRTRRVCFFLIILISDFNFYLINDFFCFSFPVFITHVITPKKIRWLRIIFSIQKIFKIFW